MALLCLVVALLIFAALAESPRTRLGHVAGKRPRTPRPRGSGPKASHSAPPQAGWRGPELAPSMAAVALWPLVWQAAFFPAVC